MPSKILWLVGVFIFLTTFAIPLSLTYVMLRIKLINSFEMQTRQERIIPLFMMAFLYYITYYSLKSTGIFINLQLFILGSSVLVFVGIFINYFTKISIHLMGIGGLTGAMLALGLGIHIPVIYPLILVLLLAGLLGFARLKQGAHTEGQIYGGFLTGLLVMMMLFFLI